MRLPVGIHRAPCASSPHERSVTPETFRVLTAGHPHPSLLLSIEGRVLAVNAAGRTILGGPGGPEGRALACLVTDPQDRVAEALETWSSSGVAIGRTLRFALPDRQARYRCEGLLVTTPGERPEPRVVVHCVPLDPPRPGPPLRHRRPLGGGADRPRAADAPERAPGGGPSRRDEPVPPAAAAHPPAAAPRTIGKMEAMGSLAGGVAHDFNNLLTVIKAELELAQECTPLPDAVRDSLDAAHAAVGQAEVLVGRLLAFSRRQLVRVVELDLRQLVADAMEDLRPYLDEPEVDVEVEQAKEPLPVLADRTQMRVVVHALVRNAREALPPDGGTLRVRTKAERLDASFVRTNPGSAEGAYVAVVVEDDGAGIPHELQGRLFEPFFTTKGRGAGRGLGLAQAFGIVKALGGYLKVVSAPGEGATFTVYLPRAG